MLIYLLIILLCSVTILSFLLMNRDIVSPPVVFISPFILACVCAAAYSDKWSLNLSYKTFFVILFGCIQFLISSYITKKIIGNRFKRFNNIKTENHGTLDGITVSPYILIMFILIQIITLYVVYNSMKTVLSRYGVSGNIATLMYYYREYGMFSDRDVRISSLASNLRILSIGVTYIWIYIVCNNFVLKRNTSHILLYILSFILGILSSVILGARGEAIQLIFAAVVIYLVLQSKYNNWKPKVKLRQIVSILILLFILLISFKSVGDLLGRSSIINYGTSAADEIAKYLGAEIKNLDIYMSSPWYRGSNIVGEQTFGTILKWFFSRVGLDINIVSDTPFQKINGISLGNVYTTFYPFIYDFGFLGMLVLVGIMASISTYLYEKMGLNSRGPINIRILAYSYLIFLVAFSFFGERFYTYVINVSFLKYLIIWYLMNYIVRKKRLVIKI